MKALPAELPHLKQPDAASSSGWAWPADMTWGSPHVIDWTDAAAARLAMRDLLAAIAASAASLRHIELLAQGQRTGADELDERLFAELDS